MLAAAAAAAAALVLTAVQITGVYRTNKRVRVLGLQALDSRLRYKRAAEDTTARTDQLIIDMLLIPKY